jgi:hypothetical protein
MVSFEIGELPEIDDINLEKFKKEEPKPIKKEEPKPKIRIDIPPELEERKEPEPEEPEEPKSIIPKPIPFKPIEEPMSIIIKPKKPKKPILPEGVPPHLYKNRIEYHFRSYYSKKKDKMMYGIMTTVNGEKNIEYNKLLLLHKFRNSEHLINKLKTHRLILHRPKKDDKYYKELMGYFDRIMKRKKKKDHLMILKKRLNINSH